MKSSFVFGFILLIILIIGVFVGLPYIISVIKSGSFSLPFSLPLSKQNFPKISLPQNLAPLVPYEKQTSEPIIKIGESLYKGRISISNSGFFGTGGINLKASYSSSAGAINITGWKVKSAQRGETVVSKGIVLPQFETIPSDIWLRSGDSADIVVGASPLGGNFRANNCFGWLNNLYNFGFSLDYCPGGFRVGDLSGLDSACQDLILRAGNCRVLSDNDLNQQSNQCRRWAEQNMNYNSCVVSHRNDSDFYKEWKIYTGNNNQIFNSLHDKIELRDQAGLLVDSYEY